MVLPMGRPDRQLKWWTWPNFLARDWKQYLRERSTYDRRTGCWVWNGRLTNRGYGIFTLKYKGQKKELLVHRVAHVVFIGPIPAGYEVDHYKCFNRQCWTPKHLEAVAGLVNNQRAWERNRTTHCPQGHEFTPENTKVRRGARECKRCNIDRVTRWQAANPDKVKEYKQRHQDRRRGKVDA